MPDALQDEDYRFAATLLGCEYAALRAVAEVESPKGPFNQDGSPTTLFEGHKFHAYTRGKYDLTHPHLSYPTWTRKHYGRTWQAEQARLREAEALNRRAAWLSTSWGQFQIMGFNHAACGFMTVEQFVRAMHESAKAQLAAFVEYIRTRGLADELRDRRWADFARLYNGPAYAVNRYDVKMSDAYWKHAAS